jgi:hypothetical protein
MGMGRIVHVVNRSLEMLEVMDDGVPWTIRPGYKAVPKVLFGKPVLEDDPDGEPDAEGKPAKRPVFEIVGAGSDGGVFMEPLPYFAAERAKRQNPVMGTEDPLNPNAFETLIAVPDWGEDYSFLEQSAAIERLDRSMLPEQLQNVSIVQARGGRKKVIRTIKGKKQAVYPNARGMVQGEAIENPAGIRVT